MWNWIIEEKRFIRLGSTLLYLSRGTRDEDNDPRPEFLLLARILAWSSSSLASDTDETEVDAFDCLSASSLRRSQS